MRVAKIVAAQAVAVAVISALSGIVGAAIQRQASGPAAATSPTVVAAPAQLWLRINGVELEGGRTGARVRVVAMVDGQAYSYPSRAVWAEIGPQMSQELFPLRLGAGESGTVGVAFSLWLTGPGGDGATSEQISSYSSQEVQPARPPADGRYGANLMSGGTRSGTTARAWVRYEIRTNR